MIIFTLNHIQPFIQATQGQIETCYWDLMPFSYDNQLEIFYMHYHIDMITHGTDFVGSLTNVSANNFGMTCRFAELIKSTVIRGSERHSLIY